MINGIDPSKLNQEHGSDSNESEFYINEKANTLKIGSDQHKEEMDILRVKADQEIGNQIDGLMGKLNEKKYKFVTQLSYNELSSLFNDKGYEWTNEEVQELLKNDIIKEAYICGATLTMNVLDGKIFGNPRVRISYGEDKEDDYSESIETSEQTLYPNNVFAFRRTGLNSIQQFNKNGIFSDINNMSENFLDEYVGLIKLKGAKELEGDISFLNHNQVLEDLGLIKFIKKS